MSQTINLPIGVSTFGNSVSNDINISTLDISGINSFKTLNNGVWYSWSNGAPDAFQGFLNIKKGFGYVANVNASKTLTFAGGELDINSINYGTGLSMIAIPFENRNIGDGYIPRLKLSSIKTINSGIWKSWSNGAPTEFQGFTTSEKNKGYVVNVETVYESFLNINMQNKSEGVRFNVNNVNITDNTVNNGVRYTNPNGLGTLSFDSIEFDQTIPTGIMFFSVNGKVAKIDFPLELLDKSFFITHNGIMYMGTFTENESYGSPIIVNTVVDNNTLEITYNSINGINPTTALYKEMVINLNGNRYILEFATEYLGMAFKVWKDGKIGSGVFTAGTVTMTL